MNHILLPGTFGSRRARAPRQPGRADQANLVRAALAIPAIFVLSGCSTGVSEYDLAQAEYEEHMEQKYEPTEEQLLAEADAASEQFAAESTRWSCYYDPTMNDNWHDDVVCTNGLANDRPILLPDDSFIEYDEIMQAAIEHEALLNG